MQKFNHCPWLRGLFILLVLCYSGRLTAKSKVNANLLDENHPLQFLTTHQFKSKFLDANLVTKESKETRIIFIPGLGYEKGSERSKKRPYAENISRALDNYTRFFNSSALTLDGSHTQFGDMLHIVACSRRPVREKRIKPTTRIYEVASGIANNWLQNPLNESQHEQFNIMGFSQGSVTTAQAVIDLFRNPSKYKLNEQFKITYLLLGGTTIRKDTPLFRELVKLQEKGKIDYIIYDEAQLPGDIVTGLGGKTIFGSIINLVKYIKDN